MVPRTLFQKRYTRGGEKVVTVENERTALAPSRIRPFTQLLVQFSHWIISSENKFFFLTYSPDRPYQSAARYWVVPHHQSTNKQTNRIHSQLSQNLAWESTQRQMNLSWDRHVLVTDKTVRYGTVSDDKIRYHTLVFFLARSGLGKILRNLQNVRAYYMLNHRIRCVYIET